MKKQISQSIVAQDNSEISNAKMSIKKDKSITVNKAKYTVFGFLLGVLSSIIATIVYENFIK